MTEFAVYKNTSPGSGAKEFLIALLANHHIDALFAPAETPWSPLPMPHLFTSTDNTDRLAPLAPVMPLNAATQAAQVLKEPNGKRIGIVLKPCEIRALIELAKLNQCVLDDHAVIIGMECRGRLENSVYLEQVNTSPEFVSAFYRDEALREDIAVSCQRCVDFLPAKADIAILTLDWQGDATWFAADSEKGKQLLREAVPEASGQPAARDNLLDDVRKAREERKQAQLDQVNDVIGSMEGFQKMIAECIHCQNCRNVCPVCYCRECVFKTDVFDSSPAMLFNRADKKSGIALPHGTTMFHMTRMLHVAHACVGCGQCTSACPQSIAVADFFRAAADKMQTLYGYKPGRDIDEKIPMLSFGEADEA